MTTELAVFVEHAEPDRVCDWCDDCPNDPTATPNPDCAGCSTAAYYQVTMSGGPITTRTFDVCARHLPGVQEMSEAITRH